MSGKNGFTGPNSSQDSDVGPSSPQRKRARVSSSEPSVTQGSQDVLGDVERLCGHTLHGDLSGETLCSNLHSAASY